MKFPWTTLMIWLGTRSPCGAKIGCHKNYDRVACLHCGLRCGTGKFQKKRLLHLHRQASYRLKTICDTVRQPTSDKMASSNGFCQPQVC